MEDDFVADDDDVCADDGVFDVPAADNVVVVSNAFKREVLEEPKYDDDKVLSRIITSAMSPSRILFSRFECDHAEDLRVQPLTSSELAKYQRIPSWDGNLWRYRGD